MTINLNDKAIFSAGLAKVDAGEYFDALCLFARVDSYESMLNQIGCLCALRDVGYATELYRNMIAKYYFTHNCCEDVNKLGDAVELISGYMGNKDSQSDVNKLSADEDLLGFYSLEYDDYFDTDDDEMLAEVLEYTVGNKSQRSIFYDVKSPEFSLNLCQRMERAFLEGNIAEGVELRDQFMGIETDDDQTLEMQLFLCLTEQRWEDGVPFAFRYALSTEVTARGLGACVQILSRSSVKYADVLEQLLQRLINYGEEISDLAMMDYVQIASSNIGHGEVTLKLTEILYSHYKDAGCSALALCARTFFNCGKHDLAREAILLLLRAVPWDGVAQTYLTYFNKHIKVALDTVTTKNSLARHFDIPTQLSSVAQFALLQDMEQDNLYLGADSYLLIQCLYKLCLGCIIKADVDSFYKEANALGAIVVNFIPQDKEQFFDFAKRCLAGIISESSLNMDFLRKMIQLGYRDKLVMSTNNGFYALDLSQLTVSDKAFVSALAVAASLRTVSVRKLENSYKLIKKVFNCTFNENIDTVRQLAYALLSISYKRFATSNERAYFADDEQALYKQFLEKHFKI
ncbi:MAG: hypothetical protein J1G02_00420 [Clostridiales bacterium]|nr:hypothetical protein [Clostridiales bacterium]